MTRIASRLSIAMAGVALAALAGCKEDRTARVNAPEPEPLGLLYASSAELPYAEPAPVAWAQPQQGYQWAERAYGMQQAFYDVPPDYYFDYGDEDPMVWVSDDDWSLYAEPWEDDYRYYYYEPGAAYPYFIRDADYGYGFGPTGILIAVFDNRGRYLDRELVYRLAPTAGRYYVRGRDLRNVGIRAPRLPVTAESWVQVRPRVVRSADPWLRAARDDREWRRWRERDADRELRRFVPEQRRRDTRREAFRQASTTMPAPQIERDRSNGERDERQTDRRGLAEIQHQARGQARPNRDRARVEAQRGPEPRQAGDAEQQRQAARPDADRGRERAHAERRSQAAEQRQQSARAEGQRIRDRAVAQREARAVEQQQQEARAGAERGRQQAQAERRARASQQREQGARAAAQRGREQAEAQRQARAQGQAREQARAAEQQGRPAAARAEQSRAHAERPRASQHDRGPQHQAPQVGGKEKGQGRGKPD